LLWPVRPTTTDASMDQILAFNQSNPGGGRVRILSEN